MDVRATTSRPQHKVQWRRVHNAREKSFPQGVRVSKGTKRLGTVDGQIYKTTYSTYNDFTMDKVILFLSISCAKFLCQTTVKPIYIHLLVPSSSPATSLTRWLAQSGKHIWYSFAGHQCCMCLLPQARERVWVTMIGAKPIISS